MWREVSATIARVHGAAGDDAALRRVGDDTAGPLLRWAWWRRRHQARPAGTTTATGSSTPSTMIKVSAAAMLSLVVLSVRLTSLCPSGRSQILFGLCTLDAQTPGDGV